MLEDKTAVITGAASGIGRATAILFSQEGAAVALVDSDSEKGQAVEREITERGGRAAFVLADVSRARDCQSAVQSAVKRFGGIDILFNNAGIIRRTSVMDTSVEDWDRVMAVNVRSVFLMSKYAIPSMIARGGGVIVNTASGWGLAGGRDAASYCASKAAVVNLTRAMALDHGPQRIRVNCVCPGDTNTNMLRNEAKQLGVDAQVFLGDAADRPLGRIGSPDDIAQAVLYLVSGAASFVTGAALVVDGGGLAG